jgi:hypothetical protein
VGVIKIFTRLAISHSLSTGYVGGGAHRNQIFKEKENNCEYQNERESWPGCG